ncbi:MAG: hypothetical protein ACYCZJ_15665 [Sulfuriferula sp.]
MNLTRRETLDMLWRLALGLPVLLGLAWLGGRDYAGFFVPLYKWVLGLALPGFRVLSLDIHLNHEYVFATEVIAEHIQVLYGHLLPAGFSVQASTPMAIALLHPLVLGLAALVWPRLSWRGRLLRVLASLPLLVLLEMLDVPLVLASSIHDLLSFNLAPNGVSAPWLVEWVHVMDGGGRFALSIAAAVGAAGLQRGVGRLVGRRGRMRQAHSPNGL